MNTLDALLKSYEYAEEMGLVDNHSEDTILLPIYHSKLRSNGSNIIRIELHRDSSIFKASFLDQYKDDVDKERNKSDIIVFPVTKDSASRSGRKAPSHALVDKVKYIFDENGRLLEEYKHNLLEWIEYEEKREIKNYLEIIFKFLDNGKAISDIAESITGEHEPQINGFIIKDEDTKIDLADIFLEFVILSYEDYKNVSVTEYNDLHKSFISFTNYKDQPNGICGISGREQYLTKKHRGILGNAKLISISNNKETYFGRLSKESSSIEIGRETSEKIHLMLNYLIENKNSSNRIAESQYLLTWFSEDIKNSQKIDITYNKIFDNDIEFLSILGLDSNKLAPANKKTNLAGQSIKLGRANYSDDSDFYCMVIDSFNPGRVVIKYFDVLTVSELNDKLVKWENRYSWERYDNEIGDFRPYTPSFYSIFMNAYGIERGDNNTTKLAYDNKKFMNNQYISLITSLLNGYYIPKNFEDKFKYNIRTRNRYKDVRIWNNMLLVARAILQDKDGEEFTRMLDTNNTDRSYLLGRLLSIYQNTERALYEDNQRLTNAEKYWSNYLDRPMTTINILEKKISPYSNKLKTTKPGIYSKIQNNKTAILNTLSENYNLDDKSFNLPLDYKFLFGYTAQNSSLYEKSTNIDQEENND